MKSKVYKCCAVPLCANTSIKTPNKLFVFVPRNKITRYKWLRLARRDISGISPVTHLYFCEDHFDMPNDMENYMEYHLMGSVSQIRMKPECLPTRYNCQSDRRKRTSDALEPSHVLKKRRKTLIAESKKDFKKRTVATKQVNNKEVSPGSLDLQAYLDNIPQEDAQKKSVNESIQIAEPLAAPTATSYSAGCSMSADMVCLQCKECSLCLECKSNAAHQHHYLLHLPMGRPKEEVENVIEVLRNAFAKVKNMRELTSGNKQENVEENQSTVDDGEEQIKQEYNTNNNDHNVVVKVERVDETDWSCEVEVKEENNVPEADDGSDTVTVKDVINEHECIKASEASAINNESEIMSPEMDETSVEIYPTSLIFIDVNNIKTIRTELEPGIDETQGVGLHCNSHKVNDTNKINATECRENIKDFSKQKKRHRLLQNNKSNPIEDGLS